MIDADVRLWARIESFGAYGRPGGVLQVHRLPMFKDAYRRRRCILPVDGFFEWKAIRGQKAKQPYAIAMKDGKPFGLGGLWENWKDPRQVIGFALSL